MPASSQEQHFDNLTAIIDPTNRLPAVKLDLFYESPTATRYFIQTETDQDDEDIGTLVLVNGRADDETAVSIDLVENPAYRRKGYGLAAFITSAAIVHSEGKVLTNARDFYTSAHGKKLWDLLGSYDLLDVVKPFRPVISNGVRHYKGHVRTKPVSTK
jgi:GNAT superfamily N-acetyltransferase